MAGLTNTFTPCEYCELASALLLTYLSISNELLLLRCPISNRKMKYHQQKKSNISFSPFHSFLIYFLRNSFSDSSKTRPKKKFKKTPLKYTKLRKPLEDFVRSKKTVTNNIENIFSTEIFFKIKLIQK